MTIHITRTLRLIDEDTDRIITMRVHERDVTSTSPAVEIRESVDGGDEPDRVVFLSWPMWAEARDYVDQWWDTMPEPPEPMPLTCGARFEAHVCRLDHNHAPVEAEGGFEHCSSAGVLFNVEVPF